jgi:hypothetical protein
MMPDRARDSQSVCVVYNGDHDKNLKNGGLLVASLVFLPRDHLRRSEFLTIRNDEQKEQNREEKAAAGKFCSSE